MTPTQGMKLTKFGRMSKQSFLVSNCGNFNHAQQSNEEKKNILFFGSAGDVESELIASSHTNVLLLKQVFVQAQKWHLNLDADLDELENR